MITLTRTPNTVLNLLSASKARLQEAGVVSYQREGEILLLYALDISRPALYAGDFSASRMKRLKFQRLLQKRIDGEPLQYIIGKTEFYGLPFFVSPGVFIPRPETEVLVEAVIRRCGNIVVETRLIASLQDDGLRILDLCTGSGCIAICLAKYLKYAKITATDISVKALEIAKKNAFLNDVASRIEFRKQDLFNGLKEGKKFDIIVLNPPYIKREDLKSLPQDTRREPVIALLGGEDGLDFYRKIIAEAPNYMKEGGILAMEIGDGQAEAVEKIIRGRKVFKEAKFIKDLNNIDRVLITKYEIRTTNDGI